jgi:hypothetical protein
VRGSVCRRHGNRRCHFRFSEQYLKRGSPLVFERHGVTAKCTAHRCKSHGVRFGLAAYTCKFQGASISPAAFPVQKSRRIERGAVGMGVLEKCCTPSSFPFSQPSNSSHVNIVFECTASKMSEPSTSYGMDRTGHRYGVSLRSIPTREWQEKKDRHAASSDKATEAERQAFRACHKAVVNRGSATVEDSCSDAGSSDENVSPLRLPKAQPPSGPGGCWCGGDHSPIYDDLGLFQRERWGTVDALAEEDHRVRQGKMDDPRPTASK